MKTKFILFSMALLIILASPVVAQAQAADWYFGDSTATGGTGGEFVSEDGSPSAAYLIVDGTGAFHTATTGDSVKTFYFFGESGGSNDTVVVGVYSLVGADTLLVDSVKIRLTNFSGAGDVLESVSKTVGLANGVKYAVAYLAQNDDYGTSPYDATTVQKDAGGVMPSTFAATGTYSRRPTIWVEGTSSAATGPLRRKGLLKK